MKLKKQQMIIIGVIIIALILVVSVAVVLNTGDNGSSNVCISLSERFRATEPKSLFC